jgi:hypothetical protein
MAGKTVTFGQLPDRYMRPGDEERIARFADTEVCRVCRHQFLKSRPRCPACGTPLPPVRITKKARRAERACAFCTRGGAGKSCRKCGARVHRSCRGAHERRCTVRRSDDGNT